MMPILYRADETEFDTYGIGMLSDCTFCEVTEERNGAFECVMKYPLQSLAGTPFARKIFTAAAAKSSSPPRQVTSSISAKELSPP